MIDHQATSIEGCTRNSTHRRQKQTKPWEDGSIKLQEKKTQVIRE
jgi:hypothetical protein